MLDGRWCQRPTAVPQKWSDAHLVLIRKPAKTGKDAGHYRPIGLQDQLGKLTFKALVEPYQTLIYGLTTQYPQYGYTPGRSHRDALRRVFIVLRFEPSVVPTAALYMRSSKARSPKLWWVEYKSPLT